MGLQHSMRGAALLCAASFAVLSSPGAAQQTDAAAAGAIRGSVREASTLRPVPAAAVRLTRAGGEDTPRLMTESDDTGEYVFESLSPGRYRLRVSRIGYEPTEIWVDVPSGWAIRRSLGLEPAPVELPPIDIQLAAGAPGTRPVTGDRAASGVGATRGTGGGTGFTLDSWSLSPEDLPGVPLMAEPDLLRALQRLPGVSSRGDFAASVWTRGTPWGLTQVLMDGLPLYDPLHLGGVASGISADGLESITMLPGVRPVSAAEGAGGTLDLRSARAGEQRATMSLSPMAIRAAARSRAADERVGLSVSARRSWWDIMEPPSIFTGSGSRGGVKYYFADLSARADVRVSDRLVLDAGAFGETDRLNGDIADLVVASTGEWGNRLLWGSATAAVGDVLVRAMAGTARYETRTHPMPWAAFRTDEGIPTLEVVETDLHHGTIRLTADGGFGRVRWSAGVQRIDESLLQFGPDALDRNVPGVQATATLTRTSTWGEAAFALGDALDVSSGIAYDAAEGVPGMGVRPSLRVVGRATDRLTLEWAHGEARQFAFPVAPAGVSLGPALGAGQLWVLAGNGIPPLTSRHTTLSVRLRLPDPWVLDVTGWTREIDGFHLTGVSTLSDGAVRPTSPNGSPGGEHGDGVEVSLSGSWPRWGASASYSHTRAEYTGELAHVWPSPAQRRHSVEGIVTFTPWEPLRGGLAATVETGWPLVLGPAGQCGENPRCVDLPADYDPPATYDYGRAPAFASVDLFLAWERETGALTWTVTGSVRNLLGRDNAAAFRAGTCVGAALISPVCQQLEGVERFSPGLESPAPSLAIRVRF